MKFMNMKRFGSIAMAGALALSLAVPAFAANTTTIEGGYQDIEIAVVVPESGTAQINPYGLPVEVTKSDGATKVQITDRQITSLPLSLKNQGNVPMDVNASLAVLPKGDVVIAAAKGSADKTMKVELEVAGLNDNALKLDSLDPTLDDLLLDKFAADATWANLATANKLAAPAAAKAATSVTPSKSAAAMATLGAATVADGTVTYGAKSIALFRLTGDLNAAPTKTVGGDTVDDPWVEADGFTATVVFSFKPAAKKTITVNVTGGTATASPSSAWEGTEVTLTTAPATAGQTATIVVKDASNNTITVTDGKFVMPDSNVTITVTFS